MKKKITLFIYMIMISNMCFLLSSCVYQKVKPGPMSELIGTYQLTRYTVTPDRTEETYDLSFSERTQDMMELYGVEAYLVVTGKKVGYYYYKDNNIDWKVDTIRIDYHYSINTNNEETELIREIYYTDEISTETFIPGFGSERPGFYSRSHTLNYTQDTFYGKYIKVTNVTTVEYTLVSKDVTPNYVESSIGKTLPIPYYELKKLNGILQYSLYDTNPNVMNDLNPFIYCYVDFDNSNLTSTVYYALKEDYKAGLRGDDLKKVTHTNVTVSDDEKYVYVNFKFSDADQSAIYKLNRDYCETRMTGIEFYYEFDSNLNKYVVTNKTTASSIHESLYLLDGVKDLNNRINSDIESYKG